MTDGTDEGFLEKFTREQHQRQAEALLKKLQTEESGGAPAEPGDGAEVG